MINNQYNEDNTINTIRSTTFWIGVLLVATGTVSLVYLAMVVVQIINEPEKTMLVQWLVAKVSESDLFLSGHFDNITFEIRASSALQYIFLGIIGLVMVKLLASVVRIFISNGIELMQFSGTKIEAEDQ